MSEPIESPANASASYLNKRTVPRYTFIATVEIIEPASDTHFPGRISEISRKGCYIDILNTLPRETAVRLMVSRDKGSFTAAGKIIYVQEGMGMGIAFTEVPADQMNVLDSWLDELKG